MFELTGWLVVLVVLILIEVATYNLTTIWFACGSLVAGIVSIFGVPFKYQVMVFVVVSLLILILLKPSLDKFFNQKRLKTNYEGIIGLSAKVIETVDNNAAKGVAILNGQEWTARAVSDDMIIEAGSKAKIIKISGVKLILTTDEHKDNNEKQKDNTNDEK